MIQSILLLSFLGASESCQFEAYAFDDYCDDESNTLICNYDNGACCLPEIKDDYCTECICNLDGTRHPSIATTTIFPGSTISTSTGITLKLYLLFF